MEKASHDLPRLAVRKRYPARVLTPSQKTYFLCGEFLWINSAEGITDSKLRPLNGPMANRTTIEIAEKSAFPIFFTSTLTSKSEYEFAHCSFAYLGFCGRFRWMWRSSERGNYSAQERSGGAAKDLRRLRQGKRWGAIFLENFYSRIFLWIFSRHGI